jgi:nucleotide-binding universal stress UspA family protein
MTMAEDVSRDQDPQITPHASRLTPHASPLTLLVTLDGSEFSEQILGVASRIAAEARARVVLLRVIPPSHALKQAEWGYERRIEEQDLAGYGNDQAWPRVTEVETADQAAQGAAAEAMGYLAPFVERFAGSEVQRLVREGEHPADAILTCAQEVGADLIAMATHGRGGLAHLLTGSVAESVMRAGKLPVLLFRPTTPD